MATVSDKDWTLLKVLRWSEQFLADRGIDSAKTDTELLLSSALGVERLELYLQHERLLTAAELKNFRSALVRRANHEPVQYISGQAWFMGIPFKVNPQVLIPRFDTELLVSKVIEQCRTVEADSGSLPTVIDVGTGSGAIAVSSG